MNQGKKRPIYLDHQSTTPVDPRVVEAMIPYFSEFYGNAASVDHQYGAEASTAVKHAREQISSIISSRPDEIIFTSGATEADNLALLGVMDSYKSKGSHIITCATEHKAVLDTCAYLENHGCEITYLPVDNLGMIDLDELEQSIRPDTVLISLMAANNETGVLHPLTEIGKLAREHDVLFHTDAAQAVGHIPIDVQEMYIDLLSMSGHKIYGPKGIGALYVRRISPRVKLAEQIHGGGHERGMRSGTLNVPAIVGMGKALEIAKKEMKKESKRLQALRDMLLMGLVEVVEGLEINGHPTIRLPHNLNVYLPGIESRYLLLKLKHDVAISTGAACTTAQVEPSHVIKAMGFPDERAHRSVRFGLGRKNMREEIKTVIQIFIKVFSEISGPFSIEKRFR